MDIYKGEFVLQWHITDRCNLRCRHCYVDEYSSQTDEKDFDTVLDQLEKLLSNLNFTGHLNITGGEPLLHSSLFRLLQKINERNISFALLTNGTLITRDIALRLKENGVRYVQVSLDGTEKIHDGIRGENSFRKAVNGIKYLKSCGIDTVVSFTAHKGNMKELKKLADYCDMLGVDKLWFDRVVISEKDDRNNLSLGMKEYSKLCKTASDLSKKYKVSCQRALQFISCGGSNIYSCNAGVTLLALLPDGTVMPCRRLPLTVGNIHEKSLSDIYFSNDVLKKLREREIPEGCVDCSYKEKCSGGAKCISYARHGRYDIKDPDCPL